MNEREVDTSARTTPADTASGTRGTEISFASLPPGAQVGRFTIMGVLGRGGMGIVYEARDPELGRAVALKVLPRRGHPRQEARLSREAQALAQLQHPNVVAVHDVGVTAGRVFFAMERVDGATLGEHLRRHRPDWRAVLALYVQAGKGLAAAHAKGLVHRDFKPGNVLVDREGRARVGDFGLARLADELSTPRSTPAPGSEITEPGARAGAETETSDDDDTRAPVGDEPALHDDETGDDSVAPRPAAFAAQVTEEGALVGTRAFMAPEQFAHEPATAQSDQFSFCVALWTSLYGEHPFGPGDATDRRPFLGRPLPPRRGRGPRAIARVLTRGLRLAAHERYATMTELLRALEAIPVRRRRVAMIAGAALVVIGVAAAAVVATRGDRIDCAAAGRGPGDEWTPALQAGLAARFQAARPYGATTARLFMASVDDWARRWRAVRVDACRATHERGEQSAALLDQRAACLDRGRRALSALLSSLATVDGTAVDRASSAVRELPAPEECTAARAAGRGPASPEARRVDEELATAAAEASLGRKEPAAVHADAAIVLARAIDDPGRLARALAAHSAAIASRDPRRARAQLEEAIAAAGRAGDRDAESRALIHLLDVLSDEGDVGRIETLLPLVSAREAEADRGTARDMLRAQAKARFQLGAPDLAICDRMQQVEAAPFRDAAECRCQHALFKRDVDASITACEAALASARALFGDQHPWVSGAQSNLASAYLDRGEHARAVELWRSALAITALTEGARTRTAAGDRLMLAYALVQLGRFDEALAEVQGSLDTLAMLQSAPDRTTSDALETKASVLVALRRFPEAEAAAREALAIADRLFGREQTALTSKLVIHSETLRRVGRAADALAAARRVEPIAREAFGAEHQVVALTLVLEAEALVALGRAAEALPVATRGLAIAERAQDPATIGHLTVAVGHALLERNRPGDRAAAKAAFAKARVAYAGAHENVDLSLADLAELEAKTR